jgi:hypothetical protein
MTAGDLLTDDEFECLEKIVGARGIVSTVEALTVACELKSELVAAEQGKAWRDLLVVLSRLAAAPLPD